MDGPDRWKSYRAVRLAAQLRMRQSHPERLERHQGRQRQWLGRGKRKSRMGSQSKALVDLPRALCARFRVNGTVAESCTLEMMS